MEPDFSGYATKAGLKCSDGRTIMPNAFEHQDKVKVPLVWQHDRNTPENVLGHAILENRPDGVYCYGYFNDSARAKHGREMVQHKDITMMSIWANGLVERSKQVFHGVIREVSLVLSGANPGALIENVTIRHEDSEMVLDDEAIIYTGIQFDSLEHSSSKDTDVKIENGKVIVEEKNAQTIYDGMSDEQKQVVHQLVQGALDDQDITHASGDMTVQDVYDSMTPQQQEVLHYMLGEAISAAGDPNAQHTDADGNVITGEASTKGNEVQHNVFEGKGEGESKTSIISHEDREGIIADAARGGSLKDAVDAYAIKHGIEDIDILFPDAVNFDNTPQFLQRRVEWVNTFLTSVRKSPFSRIKTFSADITEEEARAKGYIKGTLKREEFFKVSKRETTPTTIYKKQKLDRDDVIDITDFDVVVWLKGEMRVMLDEEIARAALFGDGRDIASDDKINEQNIRPIASDHELFTTTINVNINDASSSVQEVIDAIVANRRFYKGTGQPSMFCSESLISLFLLLRDSLGRRIYKSLDEVASELRVAAIVPVEAMEEVTDLLAIIVNPVDYVMGASAGGQVSMFDDFDIDYNQQKYLIETRLCGALVTLKSALVVRKVAANLVLVDPDMPTFDAQTGVLTIVNQTGVVYKNGATVVNAAGSPYAAIASGASITIDATPASGYYFETNAEDSWTFTRE